MKATIDQMKKEAMQRMVNAQIGLLHVGDFVRKGKVYSNGKPKCKEIRILEKKENILIYADFENNSNMGKTHSYLFVTAETDNWPMEREMLMQKNPIAYVHNLTVPDNSEYGQIGIKYTADGLVRSW